MTKKEKAKIQAKIEQYRKLAEDEIDKAICAENERERDAHGRQAWFNDGAADALEHLLSELS